MKTTSVLIQSLCVPCWNHCRYCLLSWDGKAVGADWDRSVRLAERLLTELREQCPEITGSFSFGYSMEHPDLRGALRTLRRLGSPAAEFLQCDGMKMRAEGECAQLMDMLRAEGIKQLNFTIYGLQAYHDRFAGRKGDHALLLRMMEAAKAAGLPFTTGVPLSEENCAEADELVEILQSAGSQRVFLTIPHEEGRGKQLSAVRLSLRDFLGLKPETQALLNRQLYRTEGEWLAEPEAYREERRMLLISLRPENIGEYERRGVISVIRELEGLDEAYYAAFPDFRELAAVYGDPEGEKLYRSRDLYGVYRARYAREHGVQVYDVTDERQSGSRRV